MIKNPDGKVYVMYYQPIPKLIKLGSRGLVCDVQHGVSMLLVDEADVSAILAIQGGCCGGKRLVFHLPSQEAVNVYLTGKR
jgi:hypothetical protein